VLLVVVGGRDIDSVNCRRLLFMLLPYVDHHQESAAC